MTARLAGDAWGAAPLSRMNEPAPAIPATRRQTVDTRAGFRGEAAKSRNCTLNPCFPAIITGLRGSFSTRGGTRFTAPQREAEVNAYTNPVLLTCPCCRT